MARSKAHVNKDPESVLALLDREYLDDSVKDSVERHTMATETGFFYGVDLDGGLGTVCAGSLTVSEGYSFLLSDYPFYRIVYTVSGQACIKEGKETVIADAGSVYYFAPKETGTVMNNTTKPWRHIFVHFTGKDADQLYEKIEAVSRRLCVMSEPDEMQQLFAQLAKNCVQQNEQSQAICDSLLRVILLKLPQTALQSIKHPSPSHLNYIQCSNFIRNNFSKITAIQDISEACSINKTYLCRLFKKYADVSPMTYVMKLKMNKASILLVQTNYSIKQISYMLNFNNQYYFSRVFRGAFGTSPKEYRQRHSL